MRAPVDRAKLETFLRLLGERTKGPGRIYLVGGATAVLSGWRSSSIDVDLKLDPEPAGVFDAIRSLKDELDINVELASPDDFIPAVPGWRDRSPHVGSFGKIEVFHFDPCTQALAKIERGHARDLADVRAMLAQRMITLDDLTKGFAAIEPELIRYPAIEPSAFRTRFEKFVHEKDSP